MPIPIETSVSAVSGGAIVLFLMKVIPVMMRKLNGNNKGKSNGKPGESKTCTDNGKLLYGHELLIKQLCANQDKSEKAAETARKENREDHKQIFDKLDALK